MTVLVVGEHDNVHINSANARAVTAAKQIGGDIHMLIAGTNCAGVASQAAELDGVSKVILVDNADFAHGLAEPLAGLLSSIGKTYSHILAPATVSGKNVLPRVAALMDVMIISEVMGIVDDATFVRPIYAGNAIQTVRSSDAIKIMTIRTTAFEACGAQSACAIEEIKHEASGPALSVWVEDQMQVSDRPELASARVVVSGGRGVGSKESFAIIEALADKLGAAVGASRAAVDAGYAPNDWQVGQTGKVVAPELYVAAGISGAIQHLAGMKDSKVIVAINKDEEAPIFQVADFGLVADLFSAVPELTAKLG